MGKIEVREIGPGFGVEVSGVEPRVPLDPETCRELQALFDKHGLLLFRGIDADAKFQTYMSWMLIGRELPADPKLAGPRGGGDYYVSNKEEGASAPFGRLLYHSDLMWRDDAFQILGLYGVEVSEPSLPTMFVSTARGWKTLPEGLRARVEGKFAITGQDATYQGRGKGDGEVLVSTFEVDEQVELPVGRRHPRTGETLLYVCQQFTRGIADMPTADSEALLEELFQHLYRPEGVYEHHWKKGDLVMWDNLALQHARPNVTAEMPTRTLRKTFAPITKEQATPAPKLTRVAG
jgi:alpha-ketoglutarate-dependent taurine dioxygenase